MGALVEGHRATSRVSIDLRSLTSPERTTKSSSDASPWRMTSAPGGAVTTRDEPTTPRSAASGHSAKAGARDSTVAYSAICLSKNWRRVRSQSNLRIRDDRILNAGWYNLDHRREAQRVASGQEANRKTSRSQAPRLEHLSR